MAHSAWKSNGQRKIGTGGQSEVGGNKLKDDGCQAVAKSTAIRSANSAFSGHLWFSALFQNPNRLHIRIRRYFSTFQPTIKTVFGARSDASRLTSMLGQQLKCHKFGANHLAAVLSCSVFLQLAAASACAMMIGNQASACCANGDKDCKPSFPWELVTHSPGPEPKTHQRRIAMMGTVWSFGQVAHWLLQQTTAEITIQFDERMAHVELNRRLP